MVIRHYPTAFLITVLKEENGFYLGAAHKQPPTQSLNIFALEVPHAKNRHISALRSMVLTPLDDRGLIRGCVFS